MYTCKVPTTVNKEAVTAGFWSGDVRSRQANWRRWNLLHCVLKLLKVIFNFFSTVCETQPSSESYGAWFLFILLLFWRFRSTHRHLLFTNVHCNGKNISTCTVSPEVTHELDWIMSCHFNVLKPRKTQFWCMVHLFLVKWWR